MRDVELIKWLNLYSSDTSLRLDKTSHRDFDCYSKIPWHIKMSSFHATTPEFTKQFVNNLRKLVIYYNNNNTYYPNIVEIMDALYVNFGPSMFVTMALKLAAWRSQIFWDVYQCLSNDDKKTLMNLAPESIKSAMRIMA